MAFRQESRVGDKLGNQVDKDRSWDKLTWLLASIASAVCTGFCLLCFNSPIAALLDERVALVALGSKPSEVIGGVSAIALLLVLPVLLTVVARRRPFLWGTFPFIVVEAFNAGYGVIASHASLSSAFNIQQLYEIPMWFVLSGIGLLIRMVIRRRRQRLAVVAATAAVSPPNSAFWPPAPKQGDEGSITPPPG